MPQSRLQGPWPLFNLPGFLPSSFNFRSLLASPITAAARASYLLVALNDPGRLRQVTGCGLGLRRPFPPIHAPWALPPEPARSASRPMSRRPSAGSRSFAPPPFFPFRALSVVAPDSIAACAVPELPASQSTVPDFDRRLSLGHALRLEPLAHPFRFSDFEFRLRPGKALRQEPPSPPSRFSDFEFRYSNFGLPVSLPPPCQVPKTRRNSP